MQSILQRFADAVGPAIRRSDPPSGRELTQIICNALKRGRRGFKEQFGGPIICRYSGCNEDNDKKYSKEGRVFKVLEYLWDFSFSRFAIPQAIEQSGAVRITDNETNKKFELLFVAESEMGSKTEICRDLLKLLEARTKIRCLIYNQPRRSKARQDFESRMIRVLNNHAYFTQSPGLWLFIALTRTRRRLDCDFFTLNENLTRIVPLAGND